MRLLFKIVSIPIILLLSIFVAIIKFLFVICAFLMTIISVILVIIGFGLFFTSTPYGGIIFLVIAFLFSPFGLQAIAGTLISWIDGLNYFLKDFFVS